MPCWPEDSKRRGGKQACIKHFSKLPAALKPFESKSCGTSITFRLRCSVLGWFYRDNLHSISFSSVFFFTFSLLHEKVSACSSALLSPYTHKQTPKVDLYWWKFWEWTTRVIFQNRFVPLYKNRKTLVQYVTGWLVQIWPYKNANEKEHSFCSRKNGQKTENV